MVPVQTSFRFEVVLRTEGWLQLLNNHSVTEHTFSNIKFSIK